MSVFLKRIERLKKAIGISAPDVTLTLTSGEVVKTYGPEAALAIMSGKVSSVDAEPGGNFLSVLLASEQEYDFNDLSDLPEVF